eukprot:XP_001706093.1 Hypothetical protein GL50803_36044 [Giardia lamblia ATCC 50803]
MHMFLKAPNCHFSVLRIVKPSNTATAQTAAPGLLVEMDMSVLQVTKMAMHRLYSWT